MPLPVNENLPTPGSFPKPTYLTLQNFKRGVITLIDKSRLPQNALQEADNLFLIEDGQPSNRPGTAWYGSAISATSRTNPILTTNLVTNPSFETNTTGWATNFSNPGGVITRVTSEQYSGAASLQVDNGPNGQRAYYAISGLTIGQYYAIQCKIKGTNGDTATLNGTFGSSVTTSITLTGGWDTLTQIVLATATSGNVFVGALGFNKTAYIDAVMIEEGTAPSPYFDGSFTNTADTDYTWTGTAHASTSTRTKYTLTAAQIDGFDYFDFDGSIHLVAACGGTIYRSTDNGTTWDACTGATVTPDITMNMNQNGNYLYLTNGEDDIIRYDGSTTLQTYTALSTPAAPTAATTPGSPGTTYTYYYKVSAVNEVGFSTASPKVTVQHGVPRSSWDATTNYITLTLPAYQATQTRYDIYFSEDDINYYYLSSQTSPNLSYKDDGSAVVVPSTLAPTGNTTQGPKVAELTNVGVRQYGVRDKDNRYRIWFTGAGTFAGAFSSAYDGGYLDWQPGGKLLPVKVVDYRDGKGTNIATIWCDSADGQGAILQMSLSTLTIGNINITVPSAYTLPGSRGTPAPGSVVNVLNDFMFYNSQAFYNLGSRAQFLNILSTDEASSNIRPTVKQISSVGERGISAVYFDAKVLFSVPRGSTTNNVTDMYDTERKSWIPNAFTIGFKKFLPYTDTNGARRLLALKPGDNRLTEISNAIQGDYGVPFRTSLLTGLYPTSRDRFEFQFTEEAEFELSSPRGVINVEVLGYERKNGYSVIKQKSENFSSSISETGWDTDPWDTDPWDNTSVVPNISSESSEKRYFTIQKELNSVQWHVTTNTLDAGYVLRALQTWGTETQAGHPTRWRIP